MSFLPWLAWLPLVPLPLPPLQQPSLLLQRLALQRYDRRMHRSSYMHDAGARLLHILHKPPLVAALTHDVSDDDEPLNVSFEMTAMA